MNKFLCTLLVLVGFATLGFSQDHVTVANSEGKEALMASKVSGEYSFTLPASVTKEMVAKNAAYYTAYFTVAFDEASKVSKITMIENDAQSRTIIARFLTACGSHQVQIDDEQVNMTDFINKYMF